jgi:hypothetical protein
MRKAIQDADLQTSAMYEIRYMADKAIAEIVHNVNAYEIESLLKDIRKRIGERIGE